MPFLVGLRDTAKEGLFIRNVTDSSSSVSGQFQQVVAAFLSQPGLPFAGLLSAERVQRVFAKHQNLFAMNGIYSTDVKGGAARIHVLPNAATLLHRNDITMHVG